MTDIEKLDTLVNKGLISEEDILEVSTLCKNRCNFQFHPTEVVTKQFDDDTTSELVAQGCLFCTVCAATRTLEFDAEFKPKSEES